jgi:hypothetical protein
LIYTAREALRIHRSQQGVLESFSQFDICGTLPELQHKFCTLWNEGIQEARKDVDNNTSFDILGEIRPLFITLHQGTDATPTQFPAPAGDEDSLLRWPWSYRLCSIASHHQDSMAHGPVPTFPIVPLPINGLPTASTRRTFSENQAVFTTSPDIATADARQGSADILAASGAVTAIHHPTAGGGLALQQAENIGTIPPSVTLGSLPIPFPTPALSHIDSSMHPLSIDSTRTDSPHTPTAPPVHPQVNTSCEQRFNQNTGVTGTRVDIQDAESLMLQRSPNIV